MSRKKKTTKKKPVRQFVLNTAVDEPTLLANQFQAVSLQFNRSKNQIRHDRMEGRDFLVVPMVMMREGVLNGSQGPLYYPSDEISKLPAIWNHKPVVVYHPTMNGVGISACAPDVLTQQKIGVIMNTRWDAKDRALKAEAWLEEERVRKVDERILKNIEEGKMTELSTGLFTDNEMTAGEHSGKKYVGIARNYKPDHLAILPDQKGACSIEDGAGLLRNSLSYDDVRQKLNNALSSKTGGLPGATEVPQNKWIRDVYDSRFVYQDGGNKLFSQRWRKVEGGVEIFGDVVEVMEHREYRTKDGEVVGNATPTTNKIVEEDGKFYACSEEGKKLSRGYSTKAEAEARLKQIEMFKHMKQNAKGTSNVGRPISNLGKKEISMDKETMVQALIDNGLFTEEERDLLMNKSDEQVARLHKTLETNKKPTKPVEDEDEEEEEEEEEEMPARNAEQGLTVEQFIANAPAEIGAVLRHGVSAYNAERERLVSEILANKANVFLKETLMAKEIAELQGIAALAKASKPVANASASYGGQGPVATPTTNVTKEEPLVAPTMNFGEDKK